jgi:hypothetical protein
MVGRNGDIIRIYTETGKLGNTRKQWFRGKLGKIFRSREKLTGVRNRNSVFVKEKGINTFPSLWEVGERYQVLFDGLLEHAILQMTPLSGK